MRKGGDQNVAKKPEMPMKGKMPMKSKGGKKGC